MHTSDYLHSDHATVKSKAHLLMLPCFFQILLSQQRMLNFSLRDLQLSNLASQPLVVGGKDQMLGVQGSWIPKTSKA